MFTWIGSIVSLISTILTSVIGFGLSENWLVLLFSVVYLFGVHGITIAIHIPLNNHIQKRVNDAAITDERVKFERKWNYYNNIRTSISVSVSLLLLILLSLR